MNDHQKLNRAAAMYKLDPNESTRQVYELLDGYRRQYLRKANGRYMNDEHALTEAFDTTLWKSLEAYDREQDFLPFFSGNLKRANVSRIRKGGAEKISKEVYDSVSEDGSSMLESIQDPERFEETVQKKRDQLELISILLAKADEFTMKVCNARVIFESDNATAKSLGIHHTKVSRTLEKLARRYDANRFGNVFQYYSA